MRQFVIISCTLQLLSLAFGEQLNIRNNCHRTILVKSSGVQSGSFFLGKGQSKKVTINRGSSARVWAHSGCDKKGRNCDTTEGYVSLAEMLFDVKGMTWYDVSHVDGYNLPVRMEPYNKAAGGNCHSASCRFDISKSCPANSKVAKRGRTVACKNLNRDTVTPYSRAIKKFCPKVYSWSKDDKDGMRACQPGNPGLHVIFC